MFDKYAKKPSKFSNYSNKPKAEYINLWIAKEDRGEKEIIYRIRLMPTHETKNPYGINIRHLHVGVGEKRVVDEPNDEGIMVQVTKRKNVSCPIVKGQYCPFNAYIDSISMEDIKGMSEKEKQIHSVIEGEEKRYVVAVLRSTTIVKTNGSKETIEEENQKPKILTYWSKSKYGTYRYESIKKGLENILDDIRNEHPDCQNPYDLLTDIRTGQDLILRASNKKFEHISKSDPCPLHPDPNMMNRWMNADYPDMMWKPETDQDKLSKIAKDFLKENDDLLFEGYEEFLVEKAVTPDINLPDDLDPTYDDKNMPWG